MATFGGDMQSPALGQSHGVISALAQLVDEMELFIESTDDLEGERAARINRIARAIRRLLQTPPQQKLLSIPTPAVTKVFTTTELLESILAHLSNLDLLKAYRVNRAFFNTIEGSLKLQRNIGLRASMEGMISIPLDGILRKWSFGIGKRPYVQDLEQAQGTTGAFSRWINITIYNPLKFIGERFGAILLCQPPIMKMTVSVNCRRQSNRCLLPTPCATITTKEGSAGITLQDVQEIVQPLWDRHLLCPFGSAVEHNADGYVKSVFNLSGPVVVSEKEASQMLLDEMQHAQARTKQKRTDAAYICAKRIGKSYSSAPWKLSRADKDVAFDKGQPIPTMAEYCCKGAVAFGVDERGIDEVLRG